MHFTENSEHKDHDCKDQDWNGTIITQINPAAKTVVINPTGCYEKHCSFNCNFNQESGGYTPPEGGIPKEDLSPEVQDSLSKADTALQESHNTSPSAHMDIRELISDANEDIELLAARVTAQEGIGGYVQHYDFGTDFPAQSVITEYVKNQIWGNAADLYNDLDIFNGTRVVNDFDNVTWILTNTPNTEPPVFEWEPAGSFSVAIATEDVAGIVKSSDEHLKVDVDIEGVMSVNGLEQALESLEERLAGIQGQVRVPVNVQVECQDVTITEPVTINIDTEEVGRQTVKTDSTGKYSARFNSQTDYSLMSNHGSINGVEVITPVVKKVKTGTLESPLNITMSAVRKDLTNTDWLQDIKETCAANKDIVYDKIEMFGGLGNEGPKWVGGTLGADGKIYGIPDFTSSILQIDPESQIANTFGNVSIASPYGNYENGVLAPDGKIYCIPHFATSVLVIDPVTQTVSTFGNFAAGEWRWQSGVLAPDGKIYCIPSNSSNVLIIDPVTKTTGTFGNVSGNNKYLGGVLAPDGKIYCIPFSASSILVIDPVTKTTSTFGSLGTQYGKWCGGVLAPNGKIYGVPTNSTGVLVIDPVSRTASTFGNLSGTEKYVAGALAPNGKIYCAPANATDILVINPENNTTSTIGNLPGTQKYAGSVLAANGKIYFIPNRESRVLCLGFDESKSLKNFGSTTLRSPYVNSF